ncbi:MAG TPA: glycoside hydrolase family 27 protein, partial [Bacteroidales bacterium]|nr:glycoside hydrolase family 27 protein [Bacteroidales bacterium]
FSDIKGMSDYIHSKGIRFGIYSSPGPQTCGGSLGSYQYELKDASNWAKWGVDYLKYDWCSYSKVVKDNSLEELKKPYAIMQQAIAKTNRDIVYSLCQYGMGDVSKWGAEVNGNLWRTTMDINDSWKSVLNTGFAQTDNYQNVNPGHWNDPDMLQVGNGGMTVNEDRAHFSMWCMLAAPLMAGNDLKNMSSQTHDILTNIDAIDIDQDAKGIQGFKYKSEEGLEIWLKPLSAGDWAVCFLNRSVDIKTIDFDWIKNKINDEFSKRILDASVETFKIKDVWTKKELGDTQKPLKADVLSHDVLLLRLSLVKK